MTEGGDVSTDGATTNAGQLTSKAADTHVAVRNALILGSSLIATWSVALLVRLGLPRRMGPELFGAFNFAETLSMTCFVFLTVGIDTYIQKEVPVRPQHGSDFFGGVVAIRTLASVFVFALMAVVVHITHHDAEVQRTAAAFGVAQLIMLNGNTVAALLQASRTVGRLAVYNIASKIIWGIGVSLALYFRAPLEFYAVAMILGEGARALMLQRIANQDLKLQFRIDFKEAWKALGQSIPYYVNGVAIALYSKIDINIMGTLTSDREVGYYGSAVNFSGIAMLLAPLMVQVVMPQMSRAAARSHDELAAMVRRTLELLITLSIPISLMLGLGADVCVRTIFGAKFEPGIDALRILSPMFPLTYMAMLAAITLTLMDRGWTVTIVSVISVGVSAALNFFLLRPALDLLGPGGAGTAAATNSVFTEHQVSITIFTIIAKVGHSVLDRRNVAAGLKSFVAAGITIAADLALRRVTNFHAGRLIADGVLYMVLIIVSGALRPRELISTVRAAIAQRRG